jgi:hypothetical protein
MKKRLSGSGFYVLSSQKNWEKKKMDEEMIVENSHQIVVILNNINSVILSYLSHKDKAVLLLAGPKLFVFE